jgi:hypothetical protein
MINFCKHTESEKYMLISQNSKSRKQTTSERQLEYWILPGKMCKTWVLATQRWVSDIFGGECVCL